MMFGLILRFVFLYHLLFLARGFAIVEYIPLQMLLPGRSAAFRCTVTSQRSLHQFVPRGGRQTSSANTPATMRAVLGMPRAFLWPRWPGMLLSGTQSSDCCSAATS
jgi:hypothetical protein